jgi:excisionase family DNA binding protein
MAEVLQLIDRNRAAATLCVSLRTLERWVARGLIPRVRVPGSRKSLFDLRDLDLFITKAKAPLPIKGRHLGQKTAPRGGGDADVDSSR